MVFARGKLFKYLIMAKELISLTHIHTQDKKMAVSCKRTLPLASRDFGKEFYRGIIAVDGGGMYINLKRNYAVNNDLFVDNFGVWRILRGSFTLPSTVVGEHNYWIDWLFTAPLIEGRG